MSNNGYNIFYTDDDADDREVFREALEEIEEDIYIFTQKNGDELMNLLKYPPPRPHLIFLDLNMPVRNGYDVLREIRQTEKFKHLPVIIFSTSADAQSISVTKDLGATLYITKPSSYNELKRVLRHVISLDWNTVTHAQGDYVYAG